MITATVKWVGATKLRHLAKGAPEKLTKDLYKTMAKIGTVWVTGARRRVPVSTSRKSGKTGKTLKGGGRPGALRQSIRFEVVPGGPRTTELHVGSNQKYAPFVEFGTARIAKGAVKRLGLGPVADAEAIKMWPALAARGGEAQQMPWLRPAWAEIETEVIAMMYKLLGGSLRPVR